MNIKAGAQILQQKGRQVRIHIQNQVAQESKRLVKNTVFGNSTRKYRRLFCMPRCNNCEKRRFVKDCS